jgi:DNA repair exonuclease SbcCD nuclease subunit
MTRCIMTADTHLGIYKSSETYHTTTINFFKTVIDTCIRENINTIIHLGDWFDERKFINILTLDVSAIIVEMIEKAGIMLIIIAGNHDTYYKDQIKPTSLSIFKEWKNVTVIDYPCVFDDFTIIPWHTETPEMLEKGGKYLLGHFEINDFDLTPSYKTNKFKFNPSDFSKFEQVITGHFHTPSHKRNITYLGSPYHQTFNDVAGVRGYYIFDNGNLEFIEFTDYPKYVIIDTETKYLPENIKGNFIRLKFLRDYGINENMKIIENVQMLEPLELYPDYSGISITQDIKSEEKHMDIKMKNHKDIFFEYIDKSVVPEHLNKDTMKKMVDSLLK